MKKLIYFLLFFFLQFSLAQDYNKVDAKVDKYPKKFSSIESLALRITKDFKTDEEKVRAAYYWVSNNISYDFKYLDSGKTPYKPITKDHHYSMKLAKQKRKYADKCFSSRNAICEGYALILNYIFKYLQIESNIVSGGTKQDIKKIGRTKSLSNHAWNVVKIYNKWKLIDATWSTGNSRKQPNIFSFSDEYFFTNPKNFILTHYPNVKEWQLLDKPVKKETFYYWPVFNSNYFNSGLKIDSFEKGIIKIKSKKTLDINYTKIDLSNSYRYKFHNKGKTKKLEFTKTRNGFKTNIILPNKKPRQLLIFCNSKLVTEFRLIP